MTDGMTLLLIFVGLPFGAAILCGRRERKLAREGSPFVKVLPIFTAILALGGVGLASVGGLEGWIWACVSVAALIGTISGWGKGRREQKLREEEDRTS